MPTARRNFSVVGFCGHIGTADNANRKAVGTLVVKLAYACESETHKSVPRINKKLSYRRETALQAALVLQADYVTVVEDVRKMSSTSPILPLLAKTNDVLKAKCDFRWKMAVLRF